MEEILNSANEDKSLLITNLKSQQDYVASLETAIKSLLDSIKSSKGQVDVWKKKIYALDEALLVHLKEGNDLDAGRLRHERENLKFSIELKENALEKMDAQYNYKLLKLAVSVKKLKHSQASLMLEYANISIAKEADKALAPLIKALQLRAYAFGLISELESQGDKANAAYKSEKDASQALLELNQQLKRLLKEAEPLDIETVPEIKSISLDPISIHLPEVGSYLQTTKALDEAERRLEQANEKSIFKPA